MITIVEYSTPLQFCRKRRAVGSSSTIEACSLAAPRPKIEAAVWHAYQAVSYRYLLSCTWRADGCLSRVCDHQYTSKTLYPIDRPSL